MQINITLFVQAVFFYFSYRMMARYIFYPALKILDTQDKKSQELKDSIEKLKKSQQNFDEKKTRGWLEIKDNLYKKSPDIATVDRKITLEDEFLLIDTDAKKIAQQKKSLKTRLSTVLKQVDL